MKNLAYSTPKQDQLSREYTIEQRGEGVAKLEQTELLPYILVCLFYCHGSISWHHGMNINVNTVFILGA